MHEFWASRTTSATADSAYFLKTNILWWSDVIPHFIWKADIQHKTFHITYQRYDIAYHKSILCHQYLARFLLAAPGRLHYLTHWDDSTTHHLHHSAFTQSSNFRFHIPPPLFLLLLFLLFSSSYFVSYFHSHSSLYAFSCSSLFVKFLPLTYPSWFTIHMQFLVLYFEVSHQRPAIQG